METNDIFKKYHVLRKKYQQLLRETKHYRYLSTHDPQLHIYNRSAFFARAAHLQKKCAEKNQKSTILFLDCDKFGTINKTKGHQYADRMIAQMIDSIQQVLRSDAIVGRYGGDEIMVFIPNAGDLAAKSCAQRILQVVRTINTVSIGAACGYSDVDTLIAQAEKNMRSAKLAGGDQYVL